MITAYSSAGPGYIEHGHLYGHRAFIFRLDRVDGDREAVADTDELSARFAASRMGRVHIVSRLGHVPEAQALAQACLRHDRNAVVSLTFGAEDDAPADLDRLGYDIVVLARPGDHISAALVDVPSTSVSVHGWPGAATMALLADHCDAPNGYFVFVSGPEVGAAKVWMNETGDSVWQVMPYYSLDTMMEPSEVETAASRTRK